MAPLPSQSQRFHASSRRTIAWRPKNASCVVGLTATSGQQPPAFDGIRTQQPYLVYKTLAVARCSGPWRGAGRSESSRLRWWVAQKGRMGRKMVVEKVTRDVRERSRGTNRDDQRERQLASGWSSCGVAGADHMRGGSCVTDSLGEVLEAGQ